MSPFVKKGWLCLVLFVLIFQWIAWYTRPETIDQHHQKSCYINGIRFFDRRRSALQEDNFFLLDQQDISDINLKQNNAMKLISIQEQDETVGFRVNSLINHIISWKHKDRNEHRQNQQKMQKTQNKDVPLLPNTKKQLEQQGTLAKPLPKQQRSKQLEQKRSGFQQKDQRKRFDFHQKGQPKRSDFQQKDQQLEQNRENTRLNNFHCGTGPLSFSPIPLTLNITALVSFPGSGNTWLRFLIQESTGILTGSEYNDTELFEKGFYGEGVVNKSVVVVKTHTPINTARNVYQKCILLVRDSKDAIKAEFNRIYSGSHTGLASQQDSQREWHRFLQINTPLWQQFHQGWDEKRPDVLIVFYQNLISDTKIELKRILRFLEVPIDEARLQCAVSNPTQNIFRRTRKSRWKT